MKKALQAILLTAYRIVLATGIMRTPLGQRGYEQCYHLYKRWFEARQIDDLRRLVRSDTSVIDVGANIGFFTLRFADWVSGTGRVIALEPDPDNFLQLQRIVARSGRSEVVDLFEGAAAETRGTSYLVRNPYHPADHRLGEHGVPISAYTLDDLLAERGWPPVSLIKIDVQGAEVRVLKGAKETLRRLHPALYIEIDDRALAEGGFSATQLVADLSALGYDMFDPVDGLGGRALDAAAAADRRAVLGYADFLFLARPALAAGP
jgi:FkbM family methyltransferase